MRRAGKHELKKGGIEVEDPRVFHFRPLWHRRNLGRRKEKGKKTPLVLFILFFCTEKQHPRTETRNACHTDRICRVSLFFERKIRKKKKLTEI